MISTFFLILTTTGNFFCKQERWKWSIIQISVMTHDLNKKHLLQKSTRWEKNKPSLHQFFCVLHIPWENNRPSRSQWQTELHKALIRTPFNGQVTNFQTITNCIDTNVDIKLTVCTIKCQKTEAPICKFLLQIIFFGENLKKL